MSFCINFISASCVKLNKIQFCNICLKKYSVNTSLLVWEPSLPRFYSLIMVTGSKAVMMAFGTAVTSPFVV